MAQSIIDKHTQRIRELINKPLINIILLKNLVQRYQLWSCLDVIGDSELAIASYSAEEFGESKGAQYLATYGLLQALILQQDAVFNLCESLKMPNHKDNYPRLKEIRDVRIASSGHPTKRNRKKGKPTSYHFISRITLTPDGFQLLSYNTNGKSEAKDISTPDLIADQRICLSDILSQVIIQLEHKEKNHKEQFRMEKLASYFSNSLYHLQKIQISTLGSTRKEAIFGAASLQMVRKTLQSFQEALEKRGAALDDYNIKFEYELIEYPMAELEAFFQALQNEGKHNISEKAAYIFAFFLQNKIEELKAMAQEIDEDYSS